MESASHIRELVQTTRAARRPHGGILTSDGVHLSALGNRTVADLMADQIGVPKMPDAAAPAPAPIPTAK